MINKKVVIICSIIAIIVVGTVVFANIKALNETDNEEETTNTYTNTYEETRAEEDNTTTEENLVSNENTEENETISQNTTEESENIAYEGEEVNSTEEDGEEKALELVKAEWGEDDSVYYTVDNQSNNIYYISVRSKSTTASLAEYQVNIETNEVLIY